jgi:hypothetical protein
MRVGRYTPRMRFRTFVSATLLVILGACAAATPPPAPTSGDEFQIESTVLAVYNVISGPAGRRDWDRFKELFVPGARMIVAKSKDGEVTTKVMTTDEYATSSQEYFKDNGFFERPIATRVERFGDIAHVFSTYESRHASSDEKPFVRSINSMQLVRNGDTWKIVTIFWQAEDATHPIPSRYLPAQ